ncbi:MAG: TonB family protein [Bacteroidota bacterium]
MGSRSILPCVFIVLLGAQCNTVVAQTPTEKLRVKLTDQWVELVGEDSMASFKLTDSSIVNADAFPIITVAAVPPAGRSPRQFTPIIVNAVITKRGNVKRAWIVSSDSPYFNKAVLKAVVQWKYQPRIANGVPQDTLVTISVPVR